MLRNFDCVSGLDVNQALFKKFLDISEVKQEPHILLNPNGRVPTLEDPNTGIVLWESGAIIEYLVETYDKEQKVSIHQFPEKYHLRQFSYFQASPSTYIAI